jgi:hypothetical protein
LNIGQLGWDYRRNLDKVKNLLSPNRNNFRSAHRWFIANSRK